MSYDTLAPWYAALERMTFGRALQQARCALLDREAEPKRVLVLGDGDGRFLEQAVKAWPGTAFVLVDQSATMLKMAKRRVEGGRVRFLKIDVCEEMEMLGDECFDVVVSHFFLDCFTIEALERLVPAVAARLSSGGCWYVSEFAAEARWHRVLLWLMYRFFHNLTETEARSFPEYGKVLWGTGFSAERLGTWRGGFVVADGWRRA